MAAFRLTERMNDKRMAGALIENAKTLKGKLAIAAVNTLGKIRPPDAVAELSAVLNSTKEEELRTACCRALGQIAQPDCIEPLTKVLNQKSFVGHIAHPQALQALAQFVNDSDQRIRKIAQSAVKTARTAPHRKKMDVPVIQ
jgi:HEAT repeat protein